MFVIPEGWSRIAPRPRRRRRNRAFFSAEKKGIDYDYGDENEDDASVLVPAVPT